MKKHLTLSLIIIIFSFSCNDQITDIHKDDIVELSFIQNSSANRTTLPELIPYNECTANEYKCGYVKGYKDVNSDKKIAMELHPNWGTQYHTKYYEVDYEESFGLGDELDTYFGDYNDNGGIDETENQVIKIYRAKFNEDLFNISFVSSDDYQFRINYLTDRKNSASNPNFWQGVIDGYTHGVWGFNLYN
ncbi:hypothetical protein OO013_07625 [Mangrovivirga sp. M17]|uniref:Lipoprotein n=1 Tax=Mangrovivirga halotolerans TaxID=2993936 RepID=A0ABT3RQU3_9BACT|nr:hypothetical protein [Mangrovivirga halotolerans]MCX2743728.1 hypothetical protein [Mangrovivirga halotolerans]